VYVPRPPPRPRPRSRSSISPAGSRNCSRRTRSRTAGRSSCGRCARRLSAPARPVLTLAQSENEYSGWQAPYSEDFVYEQELLTAWVRALPSTRHGLTQEAYHSARTESWFRRRTTTREPHPRLCIRGAWLTRARSSPSGHYTSVNIWGYDSYPNGERASILCCALGSSRGQASTARTRTRGRRAPCPSTLLCCVCARAADGRIA
jgi:hypothetical protein